MTLDEIIKLKLNRLEDVPKAYLTDIEKAQKEIYNNILDSFDLLVLDADGNFKKTQKNLAIIESIIEDLQKVFTKSDYINFTKEFISEFDEQVRVTDEFFLKSFDNYEDSSFSKKALEIAKTYNSLNTDLQRLVYLKDQKGNLKVVLDNDCTMVEFDEIRGREILEYVSEIELKQFDNYHGWTDAIVQLFEFAGITAETC